MNETTYFHTGDFGDAIAAFTAVRASGAGGLVCGWKYEGQRETLRGDRFESFRSLAEVQPYIKSCSWVESLPDKTWIDFSTFRQKYKVHENLAIQQAKHIGVEISLEPWLSVPNPIPGNVVIARSERYHNSQFPWRKILASYSDKVFVGLSKEHKSFVTSYGDLPYHPTKDLLELARVIAGASLVISNQTCAWWIAAGLGKTCIQETYLADQNSVIERPNLVYSRTAGEINVILDSLKS